MSDCMAAQINAQIEGAIRENEALRREIDKLHDLLRQIGDFAHDASTGPAVPDVLWELRAMAYDGISS